MAVYKRGYQRYTGPLTGEWTRLLAYPRFAWQRLLAQRLVIIALMLSVLPILVAATFIYLGSHQELWRGMGMGDAARLLEVNGLFFLVFTNVQAGFAVVVAALTGPGLIAPDLANGGLPLYFSRPLTRRDYVLSRMLVLVGLLSLLTWVPGLLLFVMQTSMAGGEWAVKNWHLGVGMVGGQIIWIVFVSLVALAASAWVKWRIIAGALTLALFFVTAGAGGVINAVFRERWGLYLNPAVNMSNLWREFFGVDLPMGLEVRTSAISLGLMALLFLWALHRKLRPVEVVR